MTKLQRYAKGVENETVIEGVVTGRDMLLPAYQEVWGTIVSLPEIWGMYLAKIEFGAF